MKRFVCCIFISFGLLGCTSKNDLTVDSSTAQNAANIEEIARNYTHFQLMTKEPVYVDPHLSMLCRGVTQHEVEEARKASGPHADTAVIIYMNDLAATTFRDRKVNYPVGSVIAKEKKPLVYRIDEKSPTPIPAQGVGGMVKRPPGYDPAHGDWEYFYFEDANKIERGKITSCVECHSGAANNGYVFGGWASGK